MERTATKPVVLEVPLPEGTRLPPEEMEALEALLCIVAAHRCEDLRRARAARARLEEDGWTVRLAPAWHAEARRGHDYEDACGRTRREALAELRRLTAMDTPQGCP